MPPPELPAQERPSPWAAFWGLVLEEAAALRRREERQAEADGAEDADK